MYPNYHDIDIYSDQLTIAKYLLTHKLWILWKKVRKLCKCKKVSRPQQMFLFPYPLFFPLWSSFPFQIYLVSPFLVWRGFYCKVFKDFLWVLSFNYYVIPDEKDNISPKWDIKRKNNACFIHYTFFLPKGWFKTE